MPPLAATRPRPPLCRCAGTVEQVKEVTEGLQRLDYYLTNITNEQVGRGWGGWRPGWCYSWAGQGPADAAVAQVGPIAAPPLCNAAWLLP